MRSLFSFRLLPVVFLFLWNVASLYGQCPSVGGSVQGGATICAGQRGPLLRLQGNNGNVIRWERTINNGVSWLQVSNTTINLDPGVVTTNTCYRAVVRVGNCTPARSLETCIRVNPDNAVPGTVAGAQTLCAGQQPTALTLSGQTGTVVRWESSTDSLAWTSIAHTGVSYTPSALTRTTWFRAVVQSNACPVKFSTSAKIIVQAPTNEGELSPASIQACSNLNSGILTLTNFSGTILRWEFSTDGGESWNTVPNITTPNFTYSGLPAGTRIYRVIVQSGGCAPRPSGTATIEVADPPAGGTISTTDIPNEELCRGPQQVKGSLTLAGHTGEIVRWEYIQGDGDWPTEGDPERPISQNIIEWTGATYNILRDGEVKAGNAQPLGTVTNGQRFLNQTYTFRAVVRNQTCAEVYSEPLVITVDKDCCNPPAFNNSYTISYDPTAVVDEWTTLELSVRYTPGTGDPDEHKLFYRPIGGGAFIETTADGGEIKLEDETTVLDNTGYELIIEKTCEDPGVDPSFSLRDTIICWICTRVNPARISVDNVSDTSADISWFDQTSGAYYIVEWNISGNDWVTVDTVKGVQKYTLSNLMPQTQYRFRVIKLCFINGQWQRAFAPTPVADRTYNPLRFTTTGTFPTCSNFDRFNWAKTAGSGTGNEQVRALTTDAEGNIYVLGGFRGNLEIGSFTLSSNASGYDYYLAKYDAFGTPIWVKRAGSGSVPEFTESGNGITLDNNGDVVITGRFYGSAAFGNTTVTSAGLGDIFLAKFRSTDGTHLWVRRAGGTLEDAGFGVDVDKENNIYVVGQVTGNASFGDQTSTGPNTNYDLFTAKYNGQTGTPIWVRRTGNTVEDDAARNVVIEPTFGNVFVTGYIGGDATATDVPFGNGFTLQNNTNVANAFVVSYNSEGGVNWVNSLKTAYSEGNGIDIDPQGNVVAGGWFAGTTRFKGQDQVSTNEELALVPSVDFYVAKYDGSSGRELLFTYAGGNRNDYLRGLEVDAQGGIFATGHYASPRLTGYRNGNSAVLAGTDKTNGSNATSDIFVIKMNPDLSYVKGLIGGSENNDDRSNAIALDSRGAVYVGGDYKGQGFFKKDTLTSLGGTWDAVLAQISCERLTTCELIPRSVFVANIDNNTVSVNWVREAGAASYDLRYRATNTQTWTTRTGVTAPPVIIGNLFAGLPYEVQVRTNCAPGGAGTGSSIWSDPVDFTTNPVGACGIPTSLDVDNTFNNDLIVVWDRIPGAAFYEVQWRRINDPNFNPAVRADSNMYKITGLLSNVRYDIRVRSICSERLTSPYTNIIRSTTNSGSCPQPSEITISDITPNSAMVSWVSAVTAFEYDVQWRKVGTNTWSVATVGASSPTPTSYKIDFLETNVKYEYRVRSRCGPTTNVSPYTDKRTFTTNPTCEVPQSITPLNVTKREMTLTWDAIPGAKMYYIEYKAVSANEYQVDSSRVNQITLDDLEPGTEYNIRMRVFCGNNNITEYSPTFNRRTGTECDAPRLLEAVDLTTGAIRARWVGPADAVGYKLQYKKTTDAAFNIPPVVIAVNEFEITGLTAGTEYTLCVTTICTDGTSSTVTCTNVKTVDCIAPQNVRLRVGSITTNSAVIEWDPVPGTNNVYTVTYDDDDPTTDPVTSQPLINITAFEAKNLVENKKYTVTVTVDCGNGVRQTSTVIEFTTAQRCDAPTNLAAQLNGVTATQIPVTWTGTPSATGYVLYWKENSDVGIEQKVENLAPGADAYVINGLKSNTEYVICVAARCGNGLSPRSECITIRTQSSGTGCFTPTVLVPITVFRNEATVRWSFVPDALSYTVSWRRFGQSQWTSVTTNDGNQTAFNILNLFRCTSYVVRVRARCPLGFTEWSEAQFTTLCDRLTEENTSGSAFNVYPNPNNGQFNLRFTAENETGTNEAQVQIMDMQGRTVFRQSFNVANGEHDLPIDTDKLSAGIYTLRFILNGDAQVGKMTVIE